jgi:hypothetical protein
MIMPSGGGSRPAGAPSAGRARLRAATVLYGMAIAFLVTAITFAFMPFARAAVTAPAAAGGTVNWGPGGSTTTSSAVTVRWDNTAPGQPSYDQVPRNGSQILPYTGGATYDDLNPQTNATYQQIFGNLSVTVGQTTDLSHQAVSLSFTGVANGTVSNYQYNALSVFQCWGGGSTVDGVSADEPNPTHCETVQRDVASQDAPLIAKGDVPSGLNVYVTGYEDPSGTSAHLWAQVQAGGFSSSPTPGQSSPAAGTVQFARQIGSTDQNLGRPVPVVHGVASEDVHGLVKGAANEFVATFTPAKGQNYEPSVAAAAYPLPTTYTQEHLYDDGFLVSSDPYSPGGGTGSLLSGTLVNVATLPGVFTAGHKVGVTLNDAKPPVQRCSANGFCYSAPVPGAVVDRLGTVTAGSDGSATAAFTGPSRLGNGATYDLVFTDEAHPAVRFVDLVAFSPFVPPTPNPLTISNQPPDDQTATVPFRDIEGHPQAGAFNDFNSDSSNEILLWEAPDTASETTTRTFTVTNYPADQNLGCGVQAGQPSTSACWLVFVPSNGVDTGIGGEHADPLSPSAWAQRLQVKLSFAPIPAFCSPSDQQVSAPGSELLTSAVASWVPAICARDKIQVGNVVIPDSLAREDYEQGTDSLIFTTQPVDDKIGGTRSLYAPVGLSGVTIGLNVPTANGQITDLRLDARLVAKLLTQSYVDGIDPTETSGDLLVDDRTPYTAATGGKLQVAGFAPWAISTEFTNLFADPEFRALNPGFSYTPPSNTTSSGTDPFASLVLSSTASDPIGVLWHWILSDPEARAFLDGCPDTASPMDGHPTVVNPFFSTGTYAECRSEAGTLRKTAKAEIAQTTSRFRAYAKAAAYDLGHIVPTPSGFSYTYDYAPLTYSYTNPQFPLPAWYLIPPNGSGSYENLVLADTSANLHAEENSLTNVESDIAGGALPWLVAWCGVENSQGGGCSLSATAAGTAGAWEKSAAGYGNPVMGITDASAAAQFQTVTAQLCDDHGHCVGADTQSLLKGESEFTRTSAPGVMQTSMTPDEAHGAYPLTVPVYAAVNTKGLSTTSAADYAAILGYVSGAGNQPGLTPGTLPAGYAPLPARMLAQDAAAIKTLDKLAKQPPTAPPTRTPSRSPSQSPSSTPSQTPSSPAAGGGSPKAGASPSPRASASSSPNPGPAVTASQQAYGVTAGTPVNFPAYGIVGFLAAAAVCGGAALVVERRRRLAGGPPAIRRLASVRRTFWRRHRR